jgi:hypothetical protein
MKQKLPFINIDGTNGIFFITRFLFLFPIVLISLRFHFWRLSSFDTSDGLIISVSLYDCQIKSNVCETFYYSPRGISFELVVWSHGRLCLAHSTEFRQSLAKEKLQYNDTLRKPCSRLCQKEQSILTNS